MPDAFAKSKDSNKCCLSAWPSLLSFERRIAYAEKGRLGHERKVNEAEKCCEVGQAFTKDKLVKAVFPEIKLSLQQKNRRAAMPSKFTT